MEAAMTIAREVASKSPPAIILAKHALNTIEKMSLRASYRFEQNITV
jgi:enoyl-CoA hydratase/carnithine racemase